VSAGALQKKRAEGGLAGISKGKVAKSVTEIRSLARSHTRTAINVLVGIMRSKDATAAARVTARQRHPGPRLG